MFGKRLFPGGVHPKEGIGGKAANAGNAIRELAAPPRVVIPLQQHIGAPARALVRKGDRVLMGQVIGEAGGMVSAPVHASVSGRVVAVEPCLLSNGAASAAVIIDNDYRDEWVKLDPAEHPETMSADELRRMIRDAGIVGLGGATFPAAVKLTPPAGKTIEKLIINGAECEPYLTADHRLMLEQSAGIIDGVRLIMLALDIREAVIGVEENKPDAIAALTQATEMTDGITVRGLPVCYPQGGEKQLIHAITRRKVPVGKLPIEVGCAVCNVATVYAIHQAVREGRPLISRVVTVGGLVNNPGNFMVRIGTPVEKLLDACGGVQGTAKKIVNGGPMMGVALSRTDVPVTKGTSGILALGRESLLPPETACIRCGRCMRVCPMQLQPARLDALVRLDRFDEAEKVGVMNCIECGACTFICPAKRALTQSCRTGKRVINDRKRKAAPKAQAEEKKGD